MALAMKADCERCHGFLSPRGEAFICSYECTFCPACTEALQATCPNCGGELVRRPRRKMIVVVVSADDDAPPKQLAVGKETS
jgi:uncharacterized protein